MPLQRFLLPRTLTTPLLVITSIAAFIVPLASVNVPFMLYFVAVCLVFLSLVVVLSRSELAPLTRVEKLMLASWVVYPTFTAIDLWVRTGWIWVEFQEPSRFLLVLPIFLMVRRVGLSQQALMWGVLAGAIVAGSYGLYQQLVLGFNRSTGGTHQLAAAFGDISLILGVMCIALFQPYWRSNKRWLLIVCLGLSLGLAASFASGTKGGWIAMPLMCWLAVDLLEKPTYLKRFLVLIGFIIFAVFIWFFVPFIEQRVSAIIPAIYEYFVNGKVAEASVGLRLALWHAATLIFLDNPLFGVGPGTFYIEKLAYINAGLVPNIQPHISGPHSQLFESLFESGIFGPLMVYSIYFSFIWHCRMHFNQNKALSTAGVLMAAGFINFGMFEVIWDINNAGVFYTLMMVLIAGKLSFDRQYASTIK
jgi:O-antigen ligase